MPTRFEDLLESSHPERKPEQVVANRTVTTIKEFIDKAIGGYGQLKNAASQLNQDLKSKGLSGVMGDERNKQGNRDGNNQAAAEWDKLTDQEKQHWETIAADPGKTPTIKPKFGRERQPTGSELYTQYYHSRIRRRIQRQSNQIT